MKKSNIKLNLNKKSISSLGMTKIKGGITGERACGFTGKHYQTCRGVNCATEIDCRTDVGC
ncbi:MAG: hypothetical protein AAF617_17540 [Bacteroidota bacterium]